MDALKVCEIFTKNLKTSEDEVAALVTSYKELGELVFAETVCDHSAEMDWDTILHVIDAQSRLCYFWSLPSGPITIQDTRLFKNLIFLFQAHEDAVKYVYERYDRLDDAFKAPNTAVND